MKHLMMLLAHGKWYPPNVVLGCHPNAIRKTEYIVDFERMGGGLGFLVFFGIGGWIHFFLSKHRSVFRLLPEI